MSIHSYLTEGFLSYEQQLKDYGSKVEITSGLLRRAIKETLGDDAILTTFQQLVYRKLLLETKKLEQTKIIQKGMEKIEEESEKTTKEIEPFTKTDLTKKRKKGKNVS